jgi:hypothetical protein
MKCAACGHDDVNAYDYREDIKAASGNIPPNGSKPFIELRIGIYGELTFNVCPICGTIKMEV